MADIRKPLVAEGFSIKLSCDDSHCDDSHAVRTYNWPLIIGALRAIIRCLRDNPQLQQLEPAKDRDDHLVAYSVRQALAGPIMTADACFLIDPMRDEPFRIGLDQVTWTLHCHYREQNRLQLAALRLWKTYSNAKPKLLDTAVPWLNNDEITDLEQAITTVQSITIGEPEPAAAEATDSKNEPPSESDGPCGINQWRFNGRLLDGEMTNKQHRLASYLFERLGRKVRIADVINGLKWGEIQDATIQRHGSAISTWFADRNASLVVESSDGHIWMRQI